MDESYWQKLQVWEKEASETWTSIIRSPEFIDVMNQQLENWLLFKRQLDLATEETFKAALLPTRKEQEEILRLLHLLEQQVEALAERVEQLSQAVD